MRARALLALMLAQALPACATDNPRMPQAGAARMGDAPCPGTAGVAPGTMALVVEGGLAAPFGPQIALCLPSSDGLRPVTIRRQEGTTAPGIWRGSVVGDDRSDVTISRGTGALAGLITTTRLGAYRISGTLPDQVAIERLDARQFDRDLVVPALPISDPGKAGMSACAAGETITIDLMVVYTRTAEHLVGGQAVMTETINVFVDRLNESLGQSGIPGHIVVRLLHADAVEFDETGSAVSDQRALMEPSGALKTIHDLLPKFPADLVVLLTGRGIGAGAAPTFLGDYKGTKAFADSAFAVVRLSRDRSPPDIFAHEIGHLMGAGHPTEDTNPQGAFDWSHGFQEPVTSSVCPSMQTIMVAGTCQGCAPILYWSNILDRGDQCRMGIADQKDNARTLAETACTIARLRD